MKASNHVLIPDPPSRASIDTCVQRARGVREDHFFGGNQGIKLGNLGGILPLLVFAEAEQVGFVLRSPAVEVQAVLVHNGSPQPLSLVEFGPVGDCDAMGPLTGVRGRDALAVDHQRMATSRQVAKLDYADVASTGGVGCVGGPWGQG